MAGYLRHRTKHGEVLVFCPSTTLHRLPLHALNIHDSIVDEDEGKTQPLIHRNSVVYIHSLSLLRSSFSIADHAQYLSHKVNPRFLSGISKEVATATANGRKNNYKAGRKSIAELAQSCGTPPMIDESASKVQFLEALERSRLLHLHTHCNWRYSDPLDHYVEFPNLLGSNHTDKTDDLKLTAKEIFATRLVPGTHVNLIACQGGLLEVRMGDEVMGIVPALLYSGATSTVSTLWSIADQDGARFSKRMFDSFFDQSEDQAELHSHSPGNASGVLPHAPNVKDVCFGDIAAAMQEAIIKMDLYYNEPLYYWAGFVLYGYWMFSLSLSDARQFGSTESIT
jgi:CHAT domain-containing protein